MAESVDIKKMVEIDTSIQVDYVKCEECGKELDFSLMADGWGDLQIYVEKCHCDEGDV